MATAPAGLVGSRDRCIAVAMYAKMLQTHAAGNAFAELKIL